MSFDEPLYTFFLSYTLKRVELLGHRILVCSTVVDSDSFLK